MLSKSQIDKLGERLRSGNPNADDLTLLNDYIQTFGGSYEAVVRLVREGLCLEPEVRFSKSTGSIISKLQRESIRLSQIQDIAGCRLVVPDIVEQERVLASTCTQFPDGKVKDLRKNPSHGYRAIHIIVHAFGKPVEIQIRSRLQDLWAQYSEKLADVVDSRIKYGGGDVKTRRVLNSTCLNSTVIETIELQFSGMLDSPDFAHISHVVRKQLDKVVAYREQIADDLRNAIRHLDTISGEGHDLLD